MLIIFIGKLTDRKHKQNNKNYYNKNPNAHSGFEYATNYRTTGKKWENRK